LGRHGSERIWEEHGPSPDRGSHAALVEGADVATDDAQRGGGVPRRGSARRHGVQPQSFRITDKGRQSLDTFILEPPSDAPRPLRQELAVKLLFAGAERMPELLRLVDAQRETYMRVAWLEGVAVRLKEHFMSPTIREQARA